MKKLASFGGIAVASLIIASAAQAADLKIAAHPRATPVTASSWTGFYAGFGLGFRTSRTDVSTTSFLEGTPPDSISLFSPQPFDGTAFRGSPYLGFNWQFAPRWVVGIEGDVGVASQTTSLGGFNFSPGLGSSNDSADGLSVKATWDAGARARLGYLITPATMLYVTGGGAWQRYEVTSTCSGSFCVAAQFSPPVITNATTRSGWAFGGGIETALWGHWLARAEYRYADFGTADFTNTRSSPFAAFGPAIDKFNVAMRTHTATFGLAYKFGDPIASGEFGGASAAFAMRAAPVMTSWTGPYVGLGLGARASRTDLTTTSELVAGTPEDLSRLPTGQTFDGTAFRASPYVGFNWQFTSRLLVGIESDAGFAQQTTTRPGFPFSPTFLEAGGDGDSLAVKTTWDANLRGRFGVLLTPATLAYLTSGIAWQHFEVTSICASVFPCGDRGFAPAIIESSKTKAGWTLGGGIETSLWGPWIARAEYRYADFGTTSFKIARSSTNPAFNPVVDTVDVKLRTNTVMFGLAYKFN